MWIPTGFRSWTDPVSPLHGWFAAVDSCTSSAPPPLRWWHSNLWKLSSWRHLEPAEPCISLHRWLSWVDAIQPTSAEHWQDRGDLVHCSQVSASDSNWFVCCQLRCRHTSFVRARSRNIHWLWPVDEDSHSAHVCVFVCLYKLHTVFCALYDFRYFNVIVYL